MTGTYFLFFSIGSSLAGKALGHTSVKSHLSLLEHVGEDSFRAGVAFEAEAKNAVAKLLLALNPTPGTTPVYTRRSYIERLVFGATVASFPMPASAWCGEPVPLWAYNILWNQPETQFNFRGTNASVRYRVVGDKAREKRTGVPPVLVIGAPGLGYDYLENMEALTVTDRRVIEVIKFKGSSNASLTTIEAVAEQLNAVCKAVNVSTVHVIAHGLGAAAALKFAQSGNGITVRSLILVSPYRSVGDLRPGLALPPVKKVNDIPLLASALLPTADSNSTALKSCVATSTATMRVGDGVLFSNLLLSSERLGSQGKLGDLLAKLGIPVLLASGGAKDLVDVSGWSGLPSSVKRVTFSSSGHLPFIDEKDNFLTEAKNFLDAADGKETNIEYNTEGVSLELIGETFQSLQGRASES